MAITVNSLPEIADNITGPTIICKGTSTIYTVPSILNATSYSWTLPSGATGTTTGNSITVNYGPSAISGTISVRGHNSQGDGNPSELAISLIDSNVKPANAGVIIGANTVFAGKNSVLYKIPVIANAISYIWTLPAGVSGESTSNSITVNYGMSAISGDITVKGSNCFGDGVSSKLAITVNSEPVNSLPDDAGTIAGTTTVSQGQNAVIYTVPSIANATSYIWTLPSGAIGTSATNSIAVNYGAFAISGDITVKGHNSFGDGVPSTLAITLIKLPDAAGTITGPSSICKGESATYTVPLIPNSIMYTWWAAGVFYVTDSNSITFLAPENVSSFGLTVRGNNTLGSGESSTIGINVTSPPITPLISSNGNELHSDASTGNQWYNQDGIINGATSQDYKVTANGDYYAIQTLDGCSSEISNVVHVVVTEIERVKINKAIKIYPNPVTDELVIEIGGNQEEQNFDVLDSAGRIIFKGCLVDKAIVQTGSFAPGVYLVRFENDETIEVRKIIKE